jgi:hypothetical protein
MSKRDNLGRHWRVKGSKLELFSRDPKTKKDSVIEDLDLIPLKQKETHKCGGSILRVAGMPRLFGDWKVCGKCSAEIRNEEKQEDYRPSRHRRA